MKPIPFNELSPEQQEKTLLFHAFSIGMYWQHLPTLVPDIPNLRRIFEAINPNIEQGENEYRIITASVCGEILKLLTS